jgi:DNA-binding MarR family transcriptional regulator
MTMRNYKNDMSIDEKVLMAIVRVAERFKKEASAVFKEAGLTFSQYNVLRVLDASDDGENTVRNVNRIMLVSGANMTGITKRLEKAGFIIRKGDPNDERLKRLEITAKGSQVLKDIAEEKERNITRFLENYSTEQKEQVLAMLRQILSQTPQRQP